MKTELRRSLRVRKAIKKIAKFFIVIGIFCFAAIYLRAYFPQTVQYLKSFDDSKIDTSEIDAYYDLLSKHAAPGEGLVIDLGVSDTDELKLASDRLKNFMGLKDYTIWLARHSSDKPPAYIKQLGYGHMNILFSTKVTQRREEINLLVHELSHIYVWGLDSNIFGSCDQEKLVDCAGVFLGLGVLTLNGLTDEFILLADGYKTQEKRFGYLSAEQFGYLLARYCAEHSIAESVIKPFLNSTGQKYFNIGREYLKKSGRAVNASLVSIAGIYWCSGCELPKRIPFSEKAHPLNCSGCENSSIIR